MTYPTTLEEARKMRYGTWYSSPYRGGRCSAPIPYRAISAKTRWQCSRRNGHGPGGLYCRQHARMIEKQNE
jgi:hypothetical protein